MNSEGDWSAGTIKRKEPVVSRWLAWAREIQALGQTGLHYSTDGFDQIRYARLIEIASEIFAEHTGLSPKVLAEDFFKQEGYATPKVDVRAAVFEQDRVLLVRERSDGSWSLPGGWADINEPPSKMVEREVLEESGYQVHARKVVGVFEANSARDPIQIYHAYKLVFLCDMIGGEARPSNETSEIGFFALVELPPLSATRTNIRHIQEAFAHWHDPHRLAFFD